MNNKNDPVFMNLDEAKDEYQLTIHLAQERYPIFKKATGTVVKRGFCMCEILYSCETGSFQWSKYLADESFF
ncbi:hypothetical protein [Acinetobacter chinensis]|uniref:hypothetical protein n=1 Tax=Acinetobacter chinensis TaxID=2004650 RepID=UPI00135A6902|nr:hypothetical protein [Acinetobacter chinensis]